DLWLTENSERGGDKLDLIRAGQNYGWPIITLGTRYYTYNSGSQATGSVTPFTEPVYAWSPSIAPSAIIEVKGFDAAWNGDFLMGSLKAQSLYRIRLTDNHVLMVEPIRIGHRIRDIISFADKIVIWTDDASLITIQVDQGRLKSNRSIDQNILESSLRTCVSCHSFNRDQPTEFGPSLIDVYGRKIGHDAFAYYSPALRQKTEIWDDSSLAAYLSDPAAFAPGTTMVLGDKLTPDQILEIVTLLKQLKNEPERSKKN
ncbi:MAG: aldose sugar dehydrogenase, partial [Bradyrhizobium sp.]|nr:aldose sugar dehydrogenase [Bradyrhizobium sp.]